MLYIITGPVKSGKTLLRRYILENKKISGISTDWLRSMIDPHMYKKTIEENNKIMNGFLLNFIQEIIQYSDENYVIEGDIFDITLIDKLKENNNIKVLIYLREVKPEPNEIIDSFNENMARLLSKEWTME